MSTIFSKIVSGEIPCHRIYEDESHLAFLDVNPLAEGHTLLIPKSPSVDVFNLEGPAYDALWQTAQKVARQIKRQSGCKRVAVLVLGYEVNHTHIHLIPTNSESDILPPVRSTPGQDELAAVAAKLRQPETTEPLPDTLAVTNRWNELAECFTKNIEPSTVELAKSTFVHLRLDDARAVLEIGCGGGAASECLAPTLSDGAKLIASDISPEMIGIARERLDDSIDTFIADAQNLPFEDGEFDRILANLNLMLIPDPKAAVSEAFRVLQPGGRVVYTVWGRPEHSSLMSLLPRAAKQVGLNLPAPARSNFHLGTLNAMKNILEQHGFEGVQNWYQPMIIPIQSGEEYVQWNAEMLDLMDLDESQRAALEEALCVRVDDLLKSGRPIQLEARVAVARKPLEA